jgi:hypothetical protein
LKTPKNLSQVLSQSKDIKLEGTLFEIHAHKVGLLRSSAAKVAQGFTSTASVLRCFHLTQAPFVKDEYLS